MDRTTEVLSTYASSLTYADLAPEVIHQVKRTLLDTCGCAIGGFYGEPSVIARQLATTVVSTIPARILGTSQSSAPDMAGFANSTMLRYLDCNDSYFSPGGGHPSDMIPAVLALAEASRRDGRDVITAIVVAYEVFTRLADQVHAGELGWDQGIFSVIGAACGAGKILGLSQEQMQHAISLAIVPNLPLGETRMGELAMWKGCAAASATRAGIFAAQLAALGMTGPAAPFEGRRGLWAQAVHAPVQLQPWWHDDPTPRILATHFKRFPCQIHTQGPIGLALDLRPRIVLAELAAIEVVTYASAVRSAAAEPEKWAPQTRETADHSIPYLVAAALWDGTVTPESFTPEHLGDPQVRALMQRMSVGEDPLYNQDFPAAFPCRLTLTTTAGQRLTAEALYPKGHARNPLTDAEVEEKFWGLTGSLLPEAHKRLVADTLWSCENLSSWHGLYDALTLPKI